MNSQYVCISFSFIFFFVFVFVFTLEACVFVVIFHIRMVEPECSFFHSLSLSYLFTFAFISIYFVLFSRISFRNSIRICVCYFQQIFFLFLLWFVLRSNLIKDKRCLNNLEYENKEMDFVLCVCFEYCELWVRFCISGLVINTNYNKWHFNKLQIFFFFHSFR